MWRKSASMRFLTWLDRNYTKHNGLQCMDMPAKPYGRTLLTP